MWLLIHANFKDSLAELAAIEIMHELMITYNSLMWM